MHVPQGHSQRWRGPDNDGAEAGLGARSAFGTWWPWPEMFVGVVVSGASHRLRWKGGTPAVTPAPLLTVADYPYVWAWRKKLPERKGQPCRVLVRSRMNSALVEFADGWQVVTSRNALRLRK